MLYLGALEEIKEENMEFLVFSDSHGDFHTLEKIINKHNHVNVILHLGDGAEEIWQLSLVYPQKQFYYVLGNNDSNIQAPLEQVVTLDSCKILLLHGHLFSAKKRAENLAKYAKSIGADGVFYGHTHIYHQEVIDDIFVLNPGAVKYGRDKANRYAIVTINKNKDITVESKLVNG